MKMPSKRVRRHFERACAGAAGVAFLAVLVTGTWRDPNFWLTAEQRGDALTRRGAFMEAAKTYLDPLRIGVAQYRDGAFQDAAKTFARVPGATGTFNAGDALLMHGKYKDAIAAFDRALSIRPGWKEATENKDLAIGRQQALETSGKDREQESADAYKPDAIALDQKGENKSSAPDLAAEGPGSDADLQATWLRRVQTAPGDFLRAKFAYQAGHPQPR